MSKARSSAAVPPVMVIAGEESFLRNEILAEITRGVFGDEDPGLGLVRMDPTSLGAEAPTIILDEVRTACMFAPRKLVIVDPADALFAKAEGDDADRRASSREILEKYVAAPVPDATLVLVVARNWKKSTRLHKSVDKLGGYRAVEPMRGYQVPAWIVRRASQVYARTIDPRTASRLVELVGPDLQRLDNELSKLAIYEPESPLITIEAVNALVGFQHEQEIWEMMEALMCRDAPRALRKIDEIWGLEPKTGYMAAGAVFSRLQQVLKARECLARRMPEMMVASELKVWPREAAHTLVALARSWTLDDAARWSDLFLQMDMANKSSIGTPRSNLEKFVVRFCTT